MRPRPKQCAHCQSEDIKLRKNVIASGAFQFGWYCMSCDRWAEKPVRWLKHDLLKEKLEAQGATLEQIPTVGDYSDLQPCAICGKPGEIHHWAPQAWQEAFGDEWIKWPTAPLCLKHHQLWHKTVTPALVYHNKTGS